MQESSETRDLEKSARLADSVSFDLSSFQITDQTEENERIVHDNNSAFTAYAIIPDEIALFIFDYLDLKNLFAASCVNKKWLQLASDKDTLNKFIQQHTQGNLWNYLSKNPEINSIQCYLQEVFGNKLDISTLFTENSFMAFKHDFLIENHSTTIYQKILRIQADFVQSISDLKDNKLLLQAVDDTKKILPILEISKEKNTLTLIQFKKIIPLLIRIHRLDSLITDYLCVSHYAKTRTRSMEWLNEPRKNHLLSGKAIVALVTLMDHKIVDWIFNDPKLDHLIDRLCENHILQIIDLDYVNPEVFINDTRIIRKFGDDVLLALTRAIPYSKLRLLFYSLIENNKIYYSCWSGDLLIKLGNNNHIFSSLILNHPQLVRLLNEDQFIKLAFNLNDEAIVSLLDKDIFWNFKVRNWRKFLLRLPYLDEVVKNTHAATILLPEDFFPLRSCDFRIACSLSQQIIFLKKLTQKELLQLALNHPAITLNLLNNKNIIQLWSEDLLKRLEAETIIYKYNGVKTSIQCIREYLVEREKLNLVNTSELLYPPNVPTLPKQKVSDESNQPNPIIIKINRLNNLPSSSKQKSYNIHLILGLVFVGLLTTALLATGIGGLIGVGFIVTALTALSFFHLSVNALAIGSLIAGGLIILPTIPPVITHLKNKIKRFSAENANKKQEQSRHNNSSSYLDLCQKKLISNFKPSPENLRTDIIVPETHSPLFVPTYSQKPSTQEQKNNADFNVSNSK